MTICCSSAGGTLRLTINGTVYSVRGNVTIQPTNREITAEANLDSTIYTLHKPVPTNIEMTISDSCGLKISDLMNEQCVDATIELDAVGRVYVLVQANMTGRPSLNPETGEISNVQMVAQELRELHFDV